MEKFQTNQQEKRSKFRQQYRLNDDTIAVGIIGRIVPIKNHQLFLDCWKNILSQTTKKVHAFIIGDEMQNSTPNQMKMLLTRLGENSKMIVMGDLRQSDLTNRKNGLADLVHKLKGNEFEYVEHVMMHDEDILRHPAVAEILKIY